jgi:hypothetical protein
MLCVPLGVLILPDGDPDVTGVVFTFMVEQVSSAVGVTVMEATFTDVV